MRFLNVVSSGLALTMMLTMIALTYAQPVPRAAEPSAIAGAKASGAGSGALHSDDEVVRVNRRSEPLPEQLARGANNGTRDKASNRCGELRAQVVGHRAAGHDHVDMIGAGLATTDNHDGPARGPAQWSGAAAPPSGSSTRRLSEQSARAFSRTSHKNART